mgnify:CR=1 FL=1
MQVLVDMKSRYDRETIAPALRAPTKLGGAHNEKQNRNYLSQLGVRIALQSHKPALAAMKAAYDTLRALREGQAVDTLNDVADVELIRQLTRADHYDKAIHTHLEPPSKT